MHALADGVVLLAELDQLAQFVLEELGFLAHGHELALADGDRAPAMGMRDLEVHQHVHVRLEESRVLPQEFGAVASEMREFVEKMATPYCGPHAVYESQSWFGEAAAHLKSFALVRLERDGLVFGVVALASEDTQRFYPEMGTLYLQRIGELVSHALWRFVTPVREPA